MDKPAVAEQVAAAQPDAVVHLAAISFVGHSDEAAFYAVNVVGTANLLSALAAISKPPHKVLLASSSAVYGNCQKSPISERQPPSPVNHYGMSKLAMEYMARTFIDRLPIVFTRPFNYTGPGQASNFIIPKLVKHYVLSEPAIELGNLNVEREFNDVRTVCEVYLAVLEHGKPREGYNICSGHAHTLQEVMDILTDLTGHTLRTSVNPELVRANEIHRLCGDPSKLNTLLSRSHTHIVQRDLRETLRWMLGANLPH